MPRTSSSRCFAPLVMAAAVLCLAGCVQRAPEPPAQAAQGIPPKLVVTANDSHRVIYVDPHTGKISPYSRAGFDSFLAQVSPGNPEAIHLRLRGPVSAKALVKISDIAVADGVERPKIVIDPEPMTRMRRGYDAPVQVEIVVYTVRQPDCPRPSHTTTGDFENQPSSDYGCSFMSNMAAMVADPRDMVRGEPLGQMDSTVTSEAIQRLRDDKVKQFLLDNSFTTGGGGGS